MLTRIAVSPNINVNFNIGNTRLDNLAFELFNLLHNTQQYSSSKASYFFLFYFFFQQCLNFVLYLI
jgi:hypothetical protein